MPRQAQPPRPRAKTPRAGAPVFFGGRLGFAWLLVLRGCFWFGLVWFGLVFSGVPGLGGEGAFLFR